MLAIRNVTNVWNYLRIIFSIDQTKPTNSVNRKHRKKTKRFYGVKINITFNC